MNQSDKDAMIKDAGYKAVQAVANALNIEPAVESITPVLEAAMGLDMVKLFKLSLYFGFEADGCFEKEAYFASCLLTAAAIETVLVLICLQEEDCVSGTKLYRKLKDKAPSMAFKDIIGEFNFDKTINLSWSLGWIEQDVVNPELLQAVIEDFPKLASTVYPKWATEDIEKKLKNLVADPGTEMLKVLQDMRNLVHGARWLKLNSVLDDAEFMANCKLAVLVGREIMQCLSIRIVRKFQSSLENLLPFHSMPEEQKQRVRELLMGSITDSGLPISG